MEPKKVLIFPAGTEIAFEIFQALNYSKFVQLYGANSVSSHAEFIFERCVTDLPFEGDTDFISALNGLIDRWGIDLIYPAHDSACLTLTENREKLHAEVVTSPITTVRICRSKNETYRFFKGESFVPRFFASADEIDRYPVFVKPSVGQGSEGARRIDSRKELIELIDSGPELTICEYLPGSEYTVDCFTDRHGTLRACHLRERERIRTGISVRSSLLPTDAAVTEIAQRINQALVFTGAWFFQLKKNTDGAYKLMEISPRIPGTMGVSRNLGINYPMLTLFTLWGYDVDIIDNGSQITLDRAFISRYRTDVTYSKVYMDFDDTLYVNGKVNLCAVAFLYQCADRQIPVALVTRHEGDLCQALKDWRLSEELFSEIIHLKKGEDKSESIRERDAILIDDSFAERKSVRDKTGIAVFDLDMIESLIDWRR